MSEKRNVIVPDGSDIVRERKARLLGVASGERPQPESETKPPTSVP
jgi:hypothetical protein